MDRNSILNKYEIKSIRYSGIFDINHGTFIDIDSFFLISGTHVLPRKEIEHVYMDGMTFYLECKNGKDLIVEVGKRYGENNRN